VLAIRKLYLVLISLVVVSLLAGTVVWILTARERIRAEAFVKDVVKLVPGKSSFTEAQELARQYNGIPWYTTANDMRCTFQRCTFKFVFENKPLTSIRLARYVELLGLVYVRDGIVAGRELHYVRDSGPYFPFDYEVFETPMWNEEGTVEHQREEGLWRLKVDKYGMPSTVKVQLSASSSADQRKRAYSLELSCLAKLFGCNTPSSMFPRGIPYHGAPYQTHSDQW
jgi:hypothetical protein